MTTKKPKESASPESVAESSGNVFADVGLPNPEQEMMKARLTLQIYYIIRERGLFLGRPSHRIPDGARSGRRDRRPVFSQGTRRNVRDDRLIG
jgi:hypothetical protein